jgi:hypothetical protein
MIDMRYKPMHLPQISAPFSVVVDGLNEMGIKHNTITIDPNQLTPSQGFTFCDDFEQSNKPIWVAGKNNAVVDGHHRWVNALAAEKPINVIKIELNPKDACRVLNKIQDIYEYKQRVSLEEEPVASANINDRNRMDNFESDWSIEIDENEVSETKNTKKLIGYRDRPINENSVVGNFFSLTPSNGYDKYEIEFENLLDTNELGIQYYSGQAPTDVLARIWFPNVNFNQISETRGISSINIKNKAIVEKAKKMGYDGIKYGDVLVQGIN